MESEQTEQRLSIRIDTNVRPPYRPHEYVRVEADEGFEPEAISDELPFLWALDECEEGSR